MFFMGMTKKQMVMTAGLMCVIIFGAGYRIAQLRAKEQIQPVFTAKPPIEQEKVKSRTVTVYITGAVKKSGVYTFSEGSRIVDAVYRAGAAKNAELKLINLAELMSDGQQIIVPMLGEIIGAASQAINSGLATGNGSGAVPTKININTAGINDLDRLSGIGPATAQKIIDYRKEHGRFNNLSELLQVSGIGEKKLAKFKKQISI
jgi:competence protein ComEA